MQKNLYINLVCFGGFVNQIVLKQPLAIDARSLIARPFFDPFGELFFMEFPFAADLKGGDFSFARVAVNGKRVDLEVCGCLFCGQNLAGFFQII